MSIFTTLMAIDDDGHEPGVCARYVEATREAAYACGRMAVAYGFHYVYEDGVACTCGNLAPIIYRGSHVNPTQEDPRGGYLLVCGIPDHCHPSAVDDHGQPVEYLRLSVGEDPSTYNGNEPGQATLVLTIKHVAELRDTLTVWLESRTAPSKENR